LMGEESLDMYFIRTRLEGVKSGQLYVNGINHSASRADVDWSINQRLSLNIIYLCIQQLCV